MGDLIIIVIIIAVIAFFMRVFWSFMVRRTKINLGITQILNDGSHAESMEKDIEASSNLPFNGSVKASFFASYLTLRESGLCVDYYTLVNAYLFKWETEGILSTKMNGDLIVFPTFSEKSKPTGEIELELYEILNDKAIEDGGGLDYGDLAHWGKKILALGEQELLETGDVAFDQKDRIRFTKQGYQKSLSHSSFEKYFESLTLSTFSKMDYQRQLQELSFALLLDLTEEIEALIGENADVLELLQMANRVWRIFREDRELFLSRN